MVVHGSCLHGVPLQALGRAVVFAETCRLCEALLAAEGYDVLSPAAPMSLAA